jgi:hypothetical protein
MAYDPLTSGEIAPGEPVKGTTATKIKDNFEDHEDRISDLENGSNVQYPPIIFTVTGPYHLIPSASLNGLVKTTSNFAFNITGIRLLIDEAGTSGTTEIDIKKSTGGGAYASVLSTRPSVSYTAGDDAVSSNAILNLSEVDVISGDILRLDLVSSQDGAKTFRVRIDFERTA